MSFTSKNSVPYELDLGKSASSYYYLDKIITKQEYDEEVEKSKVYYIDYEIPDSTDIQKKKGHFGFDVIIGYTTSYSTPVSQSIEPGYSPLGYDTTIPQSSILLIGDKLNVRETDYYKAIMDGKAFFVKCSDVTIAESYAEKLDSLINASNEIRDDFFETAKHYGHFISLNNRLEKLKTFHSYAKNGLVILECRPYDMSEYTEGTGMSFELLNSSNKTIKYITFNFIGYNAVDDPVTSRGKSLITRRGIGPIGPDETASYDFEYVWFTDIVEYGKIHSITIQYKDGSTRTYSGKSVAVIPSEIIEAINHKSPVDKLK